MKLRRLLQSKTLRDGSVVFASTMIVNVANYLYHMVTSRLLGVSAYGILASLVAGYSILIAAATVLNLTTVKLAAELKAVDDTARLRALCRRMTSICLYLFGGVAIVFLSTAFTLVPYLQISFAALATGVVSAGVAIVVPATRGIMQGVQDYTRLSYATIIESLGRLLCGVGLAYAGFGAAGAMAGFALGSFISLGYAMYAVRRHFRATENALTIHLDGRRLAKTSAGVALSTLALTILGFIDVLLVKHFFNAYDAGLYGVLSLAGKIIMFSVSFIPTILLPKAVDAYSKGNSPRNILIQAAGLTFALSALVLCAYFFFPSVILRIMAGPAFIAIAPSVFPYGLATACLAVTTLVATYKIGLHDFSFVPRLLVVATMEIVSIYFFHQDLAMVVRTVLLLNILGLIVSIIPAQRGPGVRLSGREPGLT